MMSENDKTKSDDKLNNASVDTDHQDGDVRCGYRSCRPEVLQTCNNPKMMISVMSFYVFAQGFVVNGIFNVSVSTLERRFQLRSAQIGLVASSYDFSAAIFGVIISYLGSGTYKPRWLTVSSICMCIGSLLMAIPHFTSGLYEWGEQAKKTCDIIESNATMTDCVSSGLQNYVGVFAFSMVVFGLGGATLYTIGTAYIDDSVPSIMSPVYMGIFFGFAALGPGIGYIIGGLFLNMYVDYDKVDTESLTLIPTDARWVGAWWIGPILTMVMFVISTLILSSFGSELPSAKAVRESRVSQLHNGVATNSKAKKPKRPDIRSMPKVFLALLRNPPFLFTTMAGITESLYISGMSTFIAKFVQNMFHVSAGRAGILSGAAVVVGLAGGISFGGFFCRCFKLKVKGMLRFAFGSCAISALCVVMMWVTCGQTKLAGVHSGYLGSKGISMHDTCNKGCACTTERFEIACDQNHIQYFSPCFAGCRESSNDQKTYSNCSCVPVPANASVSSIKLGSCEPSCTLLYVFLFLLFVFTFTSVATDVPAEQAVLRSIDENHRAIMCGSNRFFVRLLGTVPGAVIIGAVTDAGCLVWQTECGEPSSCWVYDNATISLNYFLVGIITKICSLIFFFCAGWFYKPPKNMDIDINIDPDVEDKTKVFVNESFENDLKGTQL